MVKYKKPNSMTEIQHKYCSGCGHGIVHRIICECIDELNIRDKTLGVAPVGCAVFAYYYWDFDVTEAPHGRPPAVATGMKRMLPDHLVFTYQGDGDLAAIGTAEIIHVANRGENISVIFINNAIYGMTGGQMAPTSLIGQKTKTTPFGKNYADGYPIDMSKLLSQLEGSAYIERVAVNSPARINKTKKAILKSFKIQLENKGFSMVEILAMCPVNWGVNPEASLKWIDEYLVRNFPLKIYCDVENKTKVG